MTIRRIETGMIEEVCPSGKRPAEEAAERDAPRVEFFGGTPQPRRQVGSRVS